MKYTSFPISSINLSNIQTFKQRIRRAQHRFGREIEDQCGQSLVLLSLGMVVFIAMLGLIIDMGHGQVVQRQMQVAADAASLAGARELAVQHDESTATARMEQVLADNGADPDQSIVSFENGNETAVTAKSVVPTFFTAAFGISEMPIAADSRAMYGQLAATDNLMPFAVEEDDWILGQNVILWGEKNGPGNFGWVRWSGQSPSTTDLRANIDDPSRSDVLTIGDPVSGLPGVSFNSVVNNLDAWIGKDITIFFFRPEEITGNGNNLTYIVRGFARFRMTGTYSYGEHSEIYGEFKEYVQLGGAIGPPGGPGIQTVGLVQ